MPEARGRNPGQVKVLFLAANPAQAGRLRLDHEIRQIHDKVRASTYRDSLVLVSRWAVRPQDLQQALLEVEPDIVHFSGHGTEAEEIILEESDGHAKPVGKAALSALFQLLPGRVRVVVLNACHSRPQAEAIAEHIDCAVGMARAIGNDASIEFAAAFYQAIGFGQPVGVAFELAKNALDLLGIPGAGIPELLLRPNVDAKKIIPLLPHPAVAIPPAETKPAPSYPDAVTRALSERLEAALARKRELEHAGSSVAEVNAAILDLRRTIREGGQLRAGDSLGEGRYLLLEELGRGGFCVVWRAHDRQRGEVVAIKVLHTVLSGDRIRRDRFFRGARTMAELVHPAVVRVIEREGHDGNIHYFVMELVAGVDLRRAVLERRIAPGEALRVLLIIGDAVAHAHARGLIHRDLKPANILLNDWRSPKLTDFDLVARTDTTGGTRTGALGTFIYAPPENMDHPEGADARGDVYSLGMTAIFALYGADLPAEAMRKADKIVDRLPVNSAVKAVLKKAVEWDKQARFESAGAFCEALYEAASTGQTALTRGFDRDRLERVRASVAALRAALGRAGAQRRAIGRLPWYLVIGPRGAGKTTALRGAGLDLLDPDEAGAAALGRGGTPICDGWISSEGILLDTAGRYTTESDAQEEWAALLKELRTLRSGKLLNGVIVAVSVSALADASAEQLQRLAAEVRARIGEIQAALAVIVPVYVLFTQVDRVAGFAEMFGDLTESARAAPWGATLTLDAGKTPPGERFRLELDVLIQCLHTRALRRMAIARSYDIAEKFFVFPLELGASRRPLTEFIAAVFSPAQGVAPPLFRGFYFTSGVQEGQPRARVMGAMSRAFGLLDGRPAPPTQSGSQSFFLRDVFRRVIFPDRGVATPPLPVLRKRRRLRGLGMAPVVVTALLLLLPSIISFLKNRALIIETARVSREAADIDWATNQTPPADKLDKLDKLRGHIQLLDDYRQDPPLNMAFFMFQGGKLFEPTLKQYITSLQQGFVRTTPESLEQKLANIKGDKYLEDFNNLKTYLLLGDPDRLRLAEPDVASWETAKLTQVWAENLRRVNSDLSESDLKGKLEPHVRYYVDLLRRGVIKAEPLDQPLIERARDILRRAGPIKQYYDRFVTALIDQKYVESEPNTRENQKYPSITLNDLFADRPEVLTKVHSGLKEREGTWGEVQGPYTYKGHQQVLASLADGISILEREKWVVPLTLEEQEQGVTIKQALDRVRQDYDTEYIRQWVNFFRDIDVDLPRASSRAAISQYLILSTPDWPYERLLRAMADNTQFEEVRAAQESSQPAGDGGVVGHVRTKLQVRQRFDPVPDKFKSMVRFGVREKGETGEAPLAQYIDLLIQLDGDLEAMEDQVALLRAPAQQTAKRNAEYGKLRLKAEAQLKHARALLRKMDDTGQELLGPLLLAPLQGVLYLGLCPDGTQAINGCPKQR